MPRFRIRTSQGQELEVEPGRIMIGREARCDIVLDDAVASRFHAALDLVGGMLTIEDLGSTNGVQVNGEALVGTRHLSHGDRIVIGSSELEVVDDEWLVHERPTHRPPPRSDRGSYRRISVEGNRPTLPLEPVARGGSRESLSMLLETTDRALLEARLPEAEQALKSLIVSLRAHILRGEELAGPLLDRVADLCLELCDLAGDRDFIDRMLELAATAGRSLAPRHLERTLRLAVSLRWVPGEALGRYVSSLRARGVRMTDADRRLLEELRQLRRAV